jgi:hypothetical protein
VLRCRAQWALGAAPSAIARYVGGFACVLNFDDVPPGVRLAAIEIGETIDSRQLSARDRLSIPTRDVWILCEGDHGPADKRGDLRFLRSFPADSFRSARCASCGQCNRRWRPPRPTAQRSLALRPASLRRPVQLCLSAMQSCVVLGTASVSARHCDASIRKQHNETEDAQSSHHSERRSDATVEAPKARAITSHSRALHV